MSVRNTVFVFFLLLISIGLHAQIRLPSVFGDHMVLQQKSEVAIWGWTSPSGNVTIETGWDTTVVRAKAENTGAWKVTITTPPAGGPFEIKLHGAGDLVLEDVLIGEVWICSGQSNMEWSLGAAIDGKEDVPNATNTNIRLFRPARSAAATPQVRGEGAWTVCSPQTAAWFSAVGYYFGKKLQENLNVPIGLMDISWGGTPAEVWVPDSLIESNAELRTSAARLPVVPWCPVKPGIVYNSMICPVIPYGMAGVIWYQGEGNTANPLTYKDVMNQLVTSWRHAFGKDFPFYYVQIAPFTYGEVEVGTLIREQQVKMLDIPKTGMVVISDQVENVKDIHPKYKKPVGERLANYALGDTYGLKDGPAYLPPRFESMKPEKDKIRITLRNAPGGLVSRGGDPAEFQIAGEDRHFFPARAKIDGSSVIVWSKNVRNPVAVRFGWPNASIPNLFSKGGLPVSCFRTDDWPILK